MFAGLIYAGKRGWAQILAPIRSARYERQRGPFIHRGERGLLFELHPGDEIERDIAVHGIYERRLLHYLETLVPVGGTVIDIGANIGNHALYLSGKAGIVHCFEPNPLAYRRLERNIALNNAANVIVHRVGMGNRDASLPFNSHDSLGRSSFVGGMGASLPIRKADDAIAELRLPSIDLLKIDVEGMEPSVFAGLSSTLAKYRPAVAFEFSGHLAKTGDWQTIRDALVGYRIYRPIFTPDGSALTKTLWNIRHAGMPELAPMETPERMWYECLIGLK